MLYAGRWHTARSLANEMSHSSVRCTTSGGLYAYHVRKIDGEGGVPKCVIFDGGSISGVEFFSENFFHYMALEDLEIFTICWPCISFGVTMFGDA